MEHIRETEIGSIQRRFVISERLLGQNKSKENEKPFDVELVIFRVRYSRVRL